MDCSLVPRPFLGGGCTLPTRDMTAQKDILLLPWRENFMLVVARFSSYGRDEIPVPEEVGYGWSIGYGWSLLILITGSSLQILHNKNITGLGSEIDLTSGKVYPT